MKLDKETFVKHQFWFLLGTYLFVWFIAILWLKVAAGGENGPIKTAKKEYETADTNQKTASRDPINVNTFCPPWKEYGHTFDGHKRVIWTKAWDYQNGMFDWPQEFRDKHDMFNFQADLSPEDRDQFRNDLYKKEVDTFRDWVPTLLGPVEMKGGFETVFERQKWTEMPTREECWLAQEDYWVKRELFYDISRAVFAQSLMYPAPFKEDEKMPEGVEQRFRFRNQNWEVTLNIRKNKEGALVVGWDSTIKNVHPSHTARPLISAKGTGIVFTVFQGNTRQALEVQGEPVPYGVAQVFNKAGGNYDPSANEKEDKKEDKKQQQQLQDIKWDKGADALKDKATDKDKAFLIGMSESFDESTCPVRRIDAIALGKQSCRTYSFPLQPNETLAQLDAPKEDPDAANKSGNTQGSGASGGMAGMSGMSGMSGGPSGGPGGGAAGMSGGPSGGKGGMSGMSGGGGASGMSGGTTANTNVTPNNSIERNRYLQPPKKDKDDSDKPSRHLPLAVQLVVDQGHMQDVLMSLANSRLRIQITQVDFHHAKDYKPQTESEKKGEGGGAGMGPMGSLFAPPNLESMYRGSMMQASPGGSGGPPPGGGSGGVRPPNAASGGSGGMPDMMRMYGGMSGNAAMMSGMPGMANMGGRRPPRMPPMTTMLPSGMERGQLMRNSGGKDKKSAQSQGDQNLVEMTVYGIATLYRRPDPEKKEGEPGQPGQPGQPNQPVQPAGGVQPTPPAAPAGGAAKQPVAPAGGGAKQP